MDISNQNKSNFVVMLARNKALKNQEMSDRQKTMSSGLAREPIEGCLILNPSKLQIMQIISSQPYVPEISKLLVKKGLSQFLPRVSRFWFPNICGLLFSNMSNLVPYVFMRITSKPPCGRNMWVANRARSYMCNYVASLTHIYLRVV